MQAALKTAETFCWSRTNDPFGYLGRKEVAIGGHPKRPFFSIVDLNQFQSHANTDEIAW